MKITINDKYFWVSILDLKQKRDVIQLTTLFDESNKVCMLDVYEDDIRYLELREVSLSLQEALDIVKTKLAKIFTIESIKERETCYIFNYVDETNHAAYIKRVENLPLEELNRYHWVEFDDYIGTNKGRITLPCYDDGSILDGVAFVPKRKSKSSITDIKAVSFLGNILRRDMNPIFDVEFNTVNIEEKLKIVEAEVLRFGDSWIEGYILDGEREIRREEREECDEWKAKKACCSECGKPLWWKRGRNYEA